MNPIIEPMTVERPSPFADHVVVHSHVDAAAGFGTWLCKRPSKDANPDGYTNAFWFRVVADRGVLTVTGDFYPTTFSFGPRDPVECVRWMGTRQPPDAYFMEKARNGSGRDATTSYCVDAAREDLRALLAEAERDAEDGPEWRAALQVGIDYPVDFDGVYGVHEIRMAVIEECDGDYDAHEALCYLGQRAASHVVLAAQALHQLTQLLESE